MEAVFLILLVLYAIIILVTFIILIAFKSSSSLNQKLMMKKIDELKNQVANLAKAGIKVETFEEAGTIKKDVIIPEPEVKKTEPEVPKVEEKKEEPEVEKQVEENKEEPEVVNQVEEKKVEPEVKKQESMQTSQTSKTIYQQQVSKAQLKKTLAPKKKTDFEKFIGENLLNKIGIVILILALVFFGKYAVDKGWLNDTAKVVAIILIGLVLVGIAHALRKNYRAFSSVLAGGGIAALYIAIAVGFQLYGLFSQTAAFAILVVITIIAVLLSLAYDKMELAVIAIFGGFATPLLVSTGEGNYKVLFTYILILDIGMLVLSYFKKWNLVNFVANFATLILYTVWIVNAHFNEDNLPHTGAFVFVTAFYVVFFLMNIINNIKEQAKFTAFEFLMLVTNSFLYFWAGMFILGDYQPEYRGLFTAGLAVFNFIFAYPLYRNKQIDKNLIFLLIGLVLTFASIAIPVQFKGKYITMFWAAEAVLLLWMSQKSGIKLMKIASYIVSFLMIISLVMDWYQIYFDRQYDAPNLRILLNPGFITGIVAVASFLISVRLLATEYTSSEEKSKGVSVFTNLFRFVLIIFLYIILLLELQYQMDVRYTDSYLTGVALGFFNYIYFAIILVWASLKKLKYILESIVIVSIISLIIYIAAVLPDYGRVVDYYLMNEISNHFAFLHFTTTVIVLVICYFVWSSLERLFSNQKALANIILWFSIIIGVTVLSLDLDYVILLGNAPETTEAMYRLVDQSHLIGWPILWGVLAFTMMIIGMKKKEKMLRVIGISLFFLAILKLFIIDVWKMSQGGRIAAFASLAVLLLVISFLYQKLKKIIFEGDEEENIEETLENE